MARMRTLKPQFFLNEGLAEIEPLGRLLFQGLWCIADRAGRLEDRPRRIKAEVLPYDDNADVPDLLYQLECGGFIERYEVGGCRYIQICTFTKHQSPHVREAESTIPAPGKPIDQHDASPMQAPDMHVDKHDASTRPAPPVTLTVTVPVSETVPEREREHGEGQGRALTLARSHATPAPPSAAASNVISNVVPLPTPAPRPSVSRPTRPPERPPDLLWDACVAACGGLAPSNKVERGKWNKGLSALRESHATPEEIALRADRYKRRYGDHIALNPMALASNWTVLATEVTTSHENSSRQQQQRSANRGGSGAGNSAHGAHGAYTGPHLPDADELREWARQQRAAGRTIIGA